jgi:hypothetical protein
VVPDAARRYPFGRVQGRGPRRRRAGARAAAELTEGRMSGTEGAMSVGGVGRRTGVARWQVRNHAALTRGRPLVGDRGHARAIVAAGSPPARARRASGRTSSARTGER